MIKGVCCTAVAVTLAMLVSACGVTDPPDGFPAAWMVTGCSPVDGPAVDLYLAETVPTDVSQPTYPHVRISVAASDDELAGNSFSFQGSTPQIFVARRCLDENQCVDATDATVEFESDGGATAEYTGELKLTFPDGSLVQGSFQANLYASLILCG